MKFKRKGLFAFALAVLMTFSFVATAYAAESGSSYFNFRIQTYQSNTQTSYSLYRNVAVTDYNKPWYVNMTSSGEGAGTVTTYWLENSTGTNVSPSQNATVGEEYWPAAYGQANSINVWLTAENNNYNSSIYSVTGYWKAASSY